MDIKGKTSFRKTGAHRLYLGGPKGEYLDVTICSLPFGFDDDMDKVLPEPEPPVRPVHGPKGEPIYKPGSKSILLTEPNIDDPAYKAKLKLNTNRRAVWMLYHGLACEEDWNWTAQRGDYEDVGKFCDALYDELKASEIPVGVAGGLMTAILELSGTPNESVEEAKQGFLSATQSETSGEQVST